MENRISIDYQNKQVDFQELVNLIEKSGNAKIAITNITPDEKALNLLESKFSEKLIYFMVWNKILVIGDSISTEFVRLHLNDFLQCFIQFDLKAHEMMDLMAKTFNIDLDDTAQLWDLKRNKSDKQRGKIDSSWDYHFHGKGCGFTNNKTGQFLDVQIIYGREYGVIDYSFLYDFIETTKSLSLQFELLNKESHNLRKVINVLKNDGYLINRPHYKFEELILNRKNLK